MKFRTLMSLAAALAGASALAAQDARPAKPAKEPKATKPAKAGKNKAVDAKPNDDPLTKKDKAIAAIDAQLAKRPIDRSLDDWRCRLSAPTKQQFDSARDYLWHLATNKGEITVRLLPETAPMHVTNAIYLTRCGYYDGLKFHRVIRGFMAQGGCPLGTGSGAPGYTFDGEFDPAVKHDTAGLLSTANSGPGTDGSQFFLTFVPTPHLDGKHTIYGRVTGGTEVLRAFDAAGGGDDAGKPSEPLVLERAWIQVVERRKDGEPGSGAGGDATGGKPGDNPPADKSGGKPGGKSGDKPAGGTKSTRE